MVKRLKSLRLQSSYLTKIESPLKIQIALLKLNDFSELQKEKSEVLYHKQNFVSFQIKRKLEKTHHDLT